MLMAPGDAWVRNQERFCVFCTLSCLGDPAPNLWRDESRTYSVHKEGNEKTEVREDTTIWPADRENAPSWNDASRSCI
jgi:hypothetical protein